MDELFALCRAMKYLPAELDGFASSNSQPNSPP
jgi:hypothetical protein